MNGTDMRIFLEVKNTRNLTKAAENLYLSQSTISCRLKALEQEMEVRLIERHKGQKNISLTPEGEDFISIAERLLLLEDEAQKLKHQNRRTYLTVGGINSLCTYILPEFYAQCIEKEQSVGFHLLVRHSWELYQMLESKEIDVGIVNHRTIYPDIMAKLLFREFFVLLRSGDCNQSDGQFTHPGELDPTLEVFQYFGPEYVQWHNYWWRPGQAFINIDNSLMIESLCRNPKLWTIVPYSIAMAIKARGDFVWSYLTEPPPDRACYVIAHKYPRNEMSPVLDNFINDLMTFMQRLNMPLQR
jgi:DNA-binding transcriptional LysR family regulator